MDDASTPGPELRDLDRPTAVAVALEVGASAARSGSPLHEVIDLVEQGYDGAPHHEAVRAACVGWAEQMSDVFHGRTCEDELTLLVSVPHLRSRVADLLRERSTTGLDAQGRLDGVLVVVELASREGNELERALDALEVGQVLRTVYPGEECLVRLTDRRFAALTQRDRADQPALSMLRILLRSQNAGAASPRLWVEELPTSVGDLIGWAAAIARR